MLEPVGKSGARHRRRRATCGRVHARAPDCHETEPGLSQRILISFCNVRQPELPVLGLFDPVLSRFRPLPRPRLPYQLDGVTGLAVDERHLYAIAQTPGTSPDGHYLALSAFLVFERKTLSLLSEYLFTMASDVHSIALDGQSVLAVSTGTDQIIKLELDGVSAVSESVYWNANSSARRADTLHLNAIVRIGGDVIVSGFGKKNGELWGTAINGFVLDTKRGREIASGIAHPHSLLDLDGRLALCESRMRTVRYVDGSLLVDLNGYTRGLCQLGAELFAGTSVGRRISKSTGAQIENPADPGESSGRCSINRIDIRERRCSQTVDLTEYGSEIYDLVSVDATDGWPVDW